MGLRSEASLSLTSSHGAVSPVPHPFGQTLERLLRESHWGYTSHEQTGMGSTQNCQDRPLVQTGDFHLTHTIGTAARLSCQSPKTVMSFLHAGWGYSDFSQEWEVYHGFLGFSCTLSHWCSWRSKIYSYSSIVISWLMHFECVFFFHDNI